MKLEIKASLLKQVLSEVIPYVKQNSSILNFSEIHLHKNKVFAFNGEVGIIYDLPFLFEDTFTVSPFSLNKLVSQFGDDDLVTLEHRENKLKVSSGNLKANFSLAPDKYNLVKDLPLDGEEVKIDNFIPRLINSSFCCSTEATKENLKGVFVTEEAIFSTDGRRFYYENGKASKELVIPDFLISRLSKEKEVPISIFTSGNKIGVKFTGNTILSQQVNHQAPKAKALVEATQELGTTSTVVYDSITFKKELLKLLTLNQDTNKVVNISWIDKETIQIENKENEQAVAKAMLKCSISDKFEPINFNGEHLKDAVSIFVEMTIKGEKDPIVFSSSTATHILSRIKNF